MSKTFRIWCGVLSGLLAVWALFLVLAPITLTFYGDDELEVRCDSVLDAGWKGKILTEDNTGRSPTYEVVRGNIPLILPEPGHGLQAYRWELGDRMESKCDRRRTTNVALTALLGAPVAVLASLSLMPYRKLYVAGWQTAPAEEHRSE